MMWMAPVVDVVMGELSSNQGPLFVWSRSRFNGRNRRRDHGVRQSSISLSLSLSSPLLDRDCQEDAEE